ncbi:Voltage-dependent T-type calcium channel subunit alpha-1H-like protein [Aix galericulata]|nr:Voltage-dependent T-type calcium channel subunit alpha-1H-like protein [Aix galericulata]
MLVILLNCVTLGMFQPCEDVECQSERCTILEAFDDFIFAFFAVEMVIKMVALGIFGQKCYLGDTWNRLDFFIVMAGMMEYSLDGHNVSLSAIRTVRVLRPLRAINRVPSMRILVTLLLDTLPMLGNVLLLCFFVFFIFGIVGVQLWAGLLRNRCFLDRNLATTYNLTFLHPYYRTDEAEENPFICSSHRENGMQKCSNIPNRKEYKVECTLSMDSYTPSLYNPDFSSRNACINWNQYYNVCMAGDVNPHNGAINFDNIGYAWIAIFQLFTGDKSVETRLWRLYRLQGIKKKNLVSKAFSNNSTGLDGCAQELLSGSPHVAAMFLPEKGQRPVCLRGACDSALKTNRCFSRGSASLLPPEHICRLQAFISCWYFISSLCMACKCTSLTHKTLATAEASADFFGKSRGSGKIFRIEIESSVTAGTEAAVGRCRWKDLNLRADVYGLQGNVHPTQDRFVWQLGGANIMLKALVREFSEETLLHSASPLLLSEGRKKNKTGCVQDSPAGTQHDENAQERKS